MRRVPVSLVVSAGLLALAACGYIPTEPSLPFARVDLRVGTGAEVTTGRTVVVHLDGWIHNPDRAEQKGIQFTTTAGGQPIFFTVGAGDVLTGLNLGLVGMREGGLRRLVLPPTLAYGSTGFGIIPPYSNLIFEVDLLEVL
jgi:FKBP-type peptidyl-prolyl cis-trans isomerase